jgi:type VI secretion system protein ImpI
MYASQNQSRQKTIKLIIKSRGQGGLGTRTSCVFGENGGTIGRATDNQWVLSDPLCEVSGLHARIVFEGDDFCLIDESTNGVFINDTSKPLGHGVKVVLRNNDYFRIGQYAIQVQTHALPQTLGYNDDDGVSDSSGSLETLFPDTEQAGDSRDRDPFSLSSASQPWSGDAANSMALFASPEERTKLSTAAPSFHEDAGSRLSWQGGSGGGYHPVEEDAASTIASSFQPHSVINQKDEDDAAFQAYLTSLSQQKTARADALSAQIKAFGPSGRPTGDGEPPARHDLKAEEQMSVLSPDNKNLWPLLQGLGLTATPIAEDAIPQFLFDVGSALRRAIEGLNALYGPDAHAGGRGFRVAVSQQQPFEDNPIKFSSSLEEALHALFITRSAVVLGAENAVGECLDGLSLHQKALEDGVFAGLQAVVHSFSPNALEQRFVKYAPSRDMAQDSAWLWSMYEQYSTQIRLKQPQGVRRLFDEVCQETYDRHVRRTNSSLSSAYAMGEPE